MKAMFIDTPGQVSIKELPMPVPKKGEALLKVLYGGICGSDLGSYRGTFAYFSYPRTPGHEFSAEIDVYKRQIHNPYRTRFLYRCSPRLPVFLSVC